METHNTVPGWKYHTATLAHLVTSAISKLILPKRYILKNPKLHEYRVNFSLSFFLTKHRTTRSYVIYPLSVELLAPFGFNKAPKIQAGFHVNGINCMGLCNKNYFFGLKALLVLPINMIMNTSC